MTGLVVVQAWQQLSLPLPSQIQFLLLAVHIPTSSKSDPSLLKILHPHWSVSVTGRFQEFVIVSHLKILSNSGFLPGTTIHWASAYTHVPSLTHTQTHTHSVHIQAHAHEHNYLATHWVSDPHIENTAERPHWWGAGRRDSFLCSPPIGAERVINMVVTRSLQHIVFPLNRERERKKPASPHFLQTVNLLVYSIPDLREFKIFRHKYRTGVFPSCVLTQGPNNKRFK